MAPKVAQPALVLRPLPRGQRPDDRAGHFGGLPHLPATFEWPRTTDGRPMLFLAEIDLANLPTAVEVAGKRFDLPERPATGLLQIFWDGFGDEGQDVSVFYRPETPDLFEQKPPDDTGATNCNIFIERNGLSACGRILRGQAFDVLPYLSSQGETELVRNMDRAAQAPGSTGVLSRDLADARQDASLERVLGRAHYPYVTMHFPWLPNTIEPKAQDAPTGLAGRLTSLFRPKPKPLADGFDATGERYGVGETFPWRWSVIRSVALGLEARALMRKEHQWKQIEGIIYAFMCGDAPPILDVWRDVPDVAREWLTRCPEADGPVPPDVAAEFRGFLRWVDAAPDRLKVLDAPDPAVLEACAPLKEVVDNATSERAYTHGRRQEGKLVDQEKTPVCHAVEAMLPMIACLRDIDDDRERHDFEPGGRWDWQHTPLPYYSEWDARHVARRELLAVLSDTTQAFVARIWRESDPSDLPPELSEIAERSVLRATTLPPVRVDGNNFGDDSRVPIQMFGASYLLQSAAEDHADKVLLFQLSEFGLPVSLMGGVMQIWIDPGDLAAGRFERAFSTFECT